MPTIDRHALLRTTLLLSVVLGLGSIQPRHVEAQRIVPVHQEPRHRLLFESDAMRVLDVQILPGDTTLFHLHDTPITYVTISTSSTDQRRIDGEWRNAVARTPPPGRIGTVRPVLSYAERPLTHRVTNIGSTLFRLIAIPNRGSGSDAAPVGQLPGDSAGDSRWFRYAVVTLEAGEATSTYTTTTPTAIVLVAEARILLERGDGWITSLEPAGDVGVLERGVEYRLVNRGAGSARLVLVEVR